MSDMPAPCAGPKSGEASRAPAASEAAPPKRTSVKAVVKRIGGGYSMKPVAAGAQAAQPKTSPPGKQARPVRLHHQCSATLHIHGLAERHHGQPHDAQNP